MNTKLITALRTAANALESGMFQYSWANQAQCNCGSLFCALTGKAPADLKNQIPKCLNTSDNRTWTVLAGQYCPIAGIPTHELFKEVLSYGLTPQDIRDLEYLRNKAVVARMVITPETPPPRARGWWRLIVKKSPAPTSVEISYTNPRHVAAYMRAWAELLQEQGAMDVVSQSQGQEQPA
jgi:hypothetical protein